MGHLFHLQFAILKNNKHIFLLIAAYKSYKQDKYTVFQYKCIPQEITYIRHMLVQHIRRSVTSDTQRLKTLSYLLTYVHKSRNFTGTYHVAKQPKTMVLYSSLFAIAVARNHNNSTEKWKNLTKQLNRGTGKFLFVRCLFRHVGKTTCYLVLKYSTAEVVWDRFAM